MSSFCSSQPPDYGVECIFHGSILQGNMLKPPIVYKVSDNVSNHERMSKNKPLLVTLVRKIAGRDPLGTTDQVNSSSEPTSSDHFSAFWLRLNKDSIFINQFSRLFPV